LYNKAGGKIMSEIHFINVGNGDCTIMKSNKGRVSVIDICKGNIEREKDKANESFAMFSSQQKGNFNMRNHPTNPLDFLSKMDVTSIWRFILTHPDMDHLDGFNNLLNTFSVSNFWDNGLIKSKPNFEGSPYKEIDWDRYEKVKSGGDNVNVIKPLAGDKNKYFNDDDESKGGDFLYVYAPNKDLVDASNQNEDFNDGSYVIVYRSQGGRILVPGDAFDSTWEYVISNYKKELEGCEIMLAPHHGRDSNRNWEFLDTLQPKFSVIGCADSKDLAYNQWNKRGLEKITQNQAGNISFYPHSDGIDVYIQNESFAESSNLDISKKDSYNHIFYKTVKKDKNY